MRTTRIFLTIAFINLFVSCYSQKVLTLQKNFKTTTYINGIFYRAKIDTLNIADENLTLSFFKNHFHKPHYLPENLVDHKYKNQTVTIWNYKSPKSDMEKQANWQSTYTYDSLSRIVNFTYSPCLVCSQHHYDYSVKYNLLGQIERVINNENIKENYRISYNILGGVNHIEVYDSSGTISALIEVLN
jgi:hypothetical protein